MRGFDIKPVAEFGDLLSRMEPGRAIFSARAEVLCTVDRDRRRTEDLLFGAQALLKRDHGLRLPAVSSAFSARQIGDLA